MSNPFLAFEFLCGLPNLYLNSWMCAKANVERNALFLAWITKAVSWESSKDWRKRQTACQMGTSASTNFHREKTLLCMWDVQKMSFSNSHCGVQRSTDETLREHFERNYWRRFSGILWGLIFLCLLPVAPFSLYQVFTVFFHVSVLNPAL